MIDGIGGTEMLHIFISASGDDIRPGATGRAVPGFEARVVGPDGAELPPGTLGRLAVRGPTGCRYLNDERQLIFVQDGWNITGDAFTADADGYFTYGTRADDMIVSSGYNIAGPEVEQALLEHAAVQKCGVVGAPNTERGNIVKAYVVLAAGFEGSDALTAALQAHVRDTVAPYKYPRAVEYVASLPKTETGKIQRFKLRSMAAAQPALNRLLGAALGTPVGGRTAVEGGTMMDGGGVTRSGDSLGGVVRDLMGQTCPAPVATQSELTGIVRGCREWPASRWSGAPRRDG